MGYTRVDTGRRGQIVGGVGGSLQCLSIMVLLVILHHNGIILPYGSRKHAGVYSYGSYRMLSFGLPFTGPVYGSWNHVVLQEL